MSTVSPAAGSSCWPAGSRTSGTCRCAPGSRVVDALVDAGLEATLRDADAGLVAALAADPAATVFPVLHGASGEDGAIRAVLELLGIHYVGSRPDACRLAFDKAIAKSVVERAGLRTPEALALASATFRDLGAPALLDALVDRLGLPLVVKPNSGGSALGDLGRAATGTSCRRRWSVPMRTPTSSWSSGS